VRGHSTSGTPSAEKLLLELQVHQVELEMQNDTLRKTQAALEESRDRYRDLYEFAPVGYLTLTTDGLIDQINLTAVTLLGGPGGSFLHRGFIRLVAPEDQDRWTRHFMALRMNSGSGKISLNLRRQDDTTFHALLQCVMPLDLGLRITLSDISAQRQADQSLQESEERLRLAFSAANQAWFDVDLLADRVVVSPEYGPMLGYDPAGLETSLSGWLDQVHPDDREAFATAFRDGLTNGNTATMEYRRQSRAGEWKWLRSVGKVVQWDAAHHATRMIGIHTDINQHKRMEDQVRQLAFFDPLTGLPNRRLLADRLSQAMAASKRSACYCALLFIDLDNFKPLNDTHGHDVGDLLLTEVANRLKSGVREMDTVARFGGDEFVVIANGLDVDQAESIVQAAAIAEKIRLSLAAPYRLVNQLDGATAGMIEHHCTATIGVTMFLNHDASGGDLLRWADAAMYEAKAADQTFPGWRAWSDLSLGKCHDEIR